MKKKPSYMLVKTGTPIMQRIDGVDHFIDSGDRWMARETVIETVPSTPFDKTIIHEEHFHGRKVECEDWIKRRVRDNNNL